ncbi:hypothetical protein [Halorubrum sp. 2020YC2]|uniref:hypothetical protein n=1 Tax=Halorubrum sp. 2020YC2 TaxID=2836432 RepID=UPI001BE568EE|nr:hypothetical protein [Halorubrum sp. 2020YC2]QWC18980.1 hypothetical protein KI388_12780 [Halorubrum sp. 2020YC2]
MKELSFEDPADAARKRSPNEAKRYLHHDQKVEELYRDGPLKSIEKEIEGMARLIVAADGEIDDEAMEILLQSFRDERSQLRYIEDQIQRNHSSE